VVLSVTEFIGHLHPLLVHLPIGILLLACFFLWISGNEKYRSLRPAVPVILFTGMISAVLTCITGYILSGTGDYDEQMVEFHQWMGIGVASLSILMFYLYNKNRLGKWQSISAVLLVILITLTGHLGGSLTHGSDYLTAPLENLSSDAIDPSKKRKPIPDIQQARVYADVAEPIFQSKCYSCHSAAKQKGKLRLDQVDLIIKGGKDGIVIVPGKASESELMKRILLPREEEHHMPPREKPQLNEKEVTLLQWWINQGADFTKLVKEIPQPDKIKPLLIELQNVVEVKPYSPGFPSENLEQAEDGAIRQLKEKGVIVIPVAQNSHFLSANFITAPGFSDKDIHLMVPLKKQLVWLKLGHTAITDSALLILGQCKNLTELQLDHTSITDRGINYISTLENLQSLNLVGTKITAAGIMKLTSLKKLHSIYLFQSAVDKKDWALLMKAFPKTSLDSGGYKLMYIESDTQTVKAPKPRY
jgi:uncharacterized membrane protein